MSFIEDIKNRALKNIRTIVLPEGNDIRTLEAAAIAVKEGYANIIILGEKEKVLELAENKYDLSKVKIIQPSKSDKYNEYVSAFYELRKDKGITIEQAQELIKNEIYFGVMMVKQGDADGLVSGACHSTSDTLRPALQILKTAPGTKIVSSFFIMIVPECEYGENGTFLFSDCGLVENPNSDELSEIAISSSKSFEKLIGRKSKIGMLSYSTHGSANSELTKKVVDATKLVNIKEPNILCEGELQLDAAIIPEISFRKSPESKLEGKANTLIFPDLNSGNIGYKLVQRLAKAEAYGPLCQGIAKPVNDLSRGCSAADIAGVIAITCVQCE